MWAIYKKFIFMTAQMISAAKELIEDVAEKDWNSGVSDQRVDQIELHISPDVFPFGLADCQTTLKQWGGHISIGWSYLHEVVIFP